MPLGESSPIARRFIQLAQDCGHSPALTQRAHEPGSKAQAPCDFAQFWRRVQTVTAHLQSRFGLQKGERLAWLGLNHELQLVTLVACARLGVIFMPLNFRLANPELQRVVDDALPRLVVHDPSHTEAALALVAPGLECIPQESLIDTPSPRGLPLPEILEADPLLLVYTSGTTGLPKGAVHTQRAVLRNAQASAWAHEFRANDKVLSTLPLFHVGGLCIQTLPALLQGVEVVLHPRFDPQAWLNELPRSRPTLSLLVPATLRAVFEHPDWPQADLSSLRGIMTGSSTIPLNYLEAFHQRGIPVGQVYGSTETGPVSVVLGLDQAVRRAGATGWPHPEAELRLVDEQDHDVPTGQTGEVCVRATNLMRGYWQPDARAGVGLDRGWFKTGDLGQLADDGCLTIVGRSKDMIISGGENIYPAEIENLLMGLPGVIECAVIGTPHSKWGEVPVAVVVVEPKGSLDESLVLAHLQGRIARFKLPHRILFEGQLPKSALGKVQKPVVAQWVRDRLEPQ